MNEFSFIVHIISDYAKLFMFRPIVTSLFGTNNNIIVNFNYLEYPIGNPVYVSVAKPLALIRCQVQKQSV